jgi:anti-sigma factor RsiW
MSDSLDCGTCVELLIDYHYDELCADERARVAGHLSQCADCALAYCQLHADFTSVDHQLAAEPSASLQQTLQQRVDQAFRPSIWRRLFRMTAAPIPAYQAVLLIVGLALLWLYLVPATVGSPKATSVMSDYDANVVVRVDPHTL